MYEPFPVIRIEGDAHEVRALIAREVGEALEHV